MDLEITVTASPLLGFGYIVALFNAAIGDAMSRMISGWTAFVAAPMAAVMTFWFALRGLQIAVNPSAAGPTLGAVAKRGVAALIIVAVSTSASLFNDNVASFFYDGLPTAAMRAMNGGDGTDLAGLPTRTGVGADRENLGDHLDVLWAHVWRAVGVVYGGLGWGFADFLAYIAIGIVVATAGIGICATAVVFVLSQFLLGLNVAIGPPFVALALFDGTRGFFDRWLGKMVALVLVKVVAFAVVVLTVKMQLAFLDMIVANPGDGELQVLLALFWILLVFAVGAFAMGASAYVAYSYGGGMAVAFLPPPPRGGPRGPAKGPGGPAPTKPTPPTPPSPPPGWYGGGGSGGPGPAPRPVPLGSRP